MPSATNPEVNAYKPPMLVYDGSCGFCSRSVQFILRHERRHDLLFVPRDSELGKQLRQSHGMEGVESMLWIDNGRVFTESEAVIRAADYLGGWWSMFAVAGAICPSALLRRLYRLVARNRRRISSSSASCVLPSAEQRSRFWADGMKLAEGPCQLCRTDLPPSFEELTGSSQPRRVRCGTVSK